GHLRQAASRRESRAVAGHKATPKPPANIAKRLAERLAERLGERLGRAIQPPHSESRRERLAERLAERLGPGGRLRTLLPLLLLLLCICIKLVQSGPHLWRDCGLLLRCVLWCSLRHGHVWRIWQWLPPVEIHPASLQLLV